MLKNVLSAIFLATLFIAHNANADGREEYDKFISTIVNTGNIDKYCHKLTVFYQQYLDDPVFTKILQETGIPNDKIENLKKCVKKVFKATVSAIKIECELKAGNNTSLVAAFDNPFKLLVLAHSPHVQEMKKKWEALENEMKRAARALRLLRDEAEVLADLH